MRKPRPVTIPATAPGAAIRQMREAATLGQRDLANALGVNQSQISVMENGRRKVPLLMLISCARVCGYELKLEAPGRISLIVDGPIQYERVRARVGAAKAKKKKRGARHATTAS